MNLEDFTLSEINQLREDSTAWFHLYEIPKVVKFIETERRMMVVRD